MSFCSSITTIGLRLSVDVLQVKIGECKYSMPIARTDVFDVTLTVMNETIIT